MFTSPKWIASWIRVVNKRPGSHNQSLSLSMKAISASIIVLAAAALVVGGSHIQHSDTALFVQVVGCGVGVIGLCGWGFAMREK
jgi:hypothetical protein